MEFESLKDRILKALDDLLDEEFTRLKWLLQQRENVAGLQPLTKKAMQNALVTDVVDMIVQKYPGNEIRIMAKLLLKVNRDDLSEMFESTPTGGATTEKGATTENTLLAQQMRDLMAEVEKVKIASSNQQTGSFPPPLPPMREPVHTYGSELTVGEASGPAVPPASTREDVLKLLGLWQADIGPYGGLVNIAVEGMFMIGWMYMPPQGCRVEDPMRRRPLFRINIWSRNASVECMYGHKGAHKGDIQAVKNDEFSIKCNQTDHHRMPGGRQEELRTWVEEEWGKMLEDFSGGWQELIIQKFDCTRQHDNCLTYRRIYLPPQSPSDLLKPGLFKGNYGPHGLEIVMLSFHETTARVTKVTGDPNVPAGQLALDVDLSRPVVLPKSIEELSLLVQVIQDEAQRQQGACGGGGGGATGAEGTEGDSGARSRSFQSGLGSGTNRPDAPQPFILPLGVRGRSEVYPHTYRKCFYGTVRLADSFFTSATRSPGLFVLFDEDRFGFISLELECLLLYSRMKEQLAHAHAPTMERFEAILLTMRSWMS